MNSKGAGAKPAKTNGPNDTPSGEGCGPSKLLPVERSKVQLPQSEADMQQLVSSLKRIPEIRQERVEALRAAIASGEYVPTKYRVAAAILNQTIGISRRP